MIIPFAEQSSTAIYHLVTQTLIPRPVAWVLTEHTNGHFNLAPFSYFTAVSSQPPLLMFSVGDKTPGVGKDSKTNLDHQPYFVVHIASARQAAAVTESSRTLPAEESELDHINEALVEFEGFPLPRLRDCKVAFGCRLHAKQAVPGAPQTLVFGEIIQLYVADDVVTTTRIEKPNGEVSERLEIAADGIAPLARLGANQYGTLGEILTVPRPK
ncbi:flavin reductase family protein [Aliidiomarina haloalkalitolerans]|uniref:Flavin reductase family protein n=1 Tax=Aliidiomarina haloalkalitolerans TaxID=859059 RepID=A0A432VYC1_9GAMM|nr:flavin reductase family protein [Aliidiomarina haloalkalitolerans]RUO21691.1 flavin reductase family protein [Aliidiomarina haloalkalitolerans]